MTQENKELLLKDLCARLPYGVIVNNEIQGDFNVYGICENIVFGRSEVGHIDFDVDKIKPYLFPLSSMTEEQKKELKVMCDWHDDEEDAQSILVLYHKHFVMKSDVIDWLIENHFDYRGLIPMGLAEDATDKNIY